MSSFLPTRFRVHGRPAFVLGATEPQARRPWVWYAPTLGRKYPGTAERWMFEQFHDHGIAIAGIDVGESYGNPGGRAVFQAFHAAMTAHGYANKPVLLARSRGGLMLYHWATEHPYQVAGIAGIYPVCNLKSYPGLVKAAPAYGMTVNQLEATLSSHNPIERVATLARAGVPIHHLHGDQDTLVPLEENTARLAQRYHEHGGAMIVDRIRGGGHDLNDHWFKSQALTDFVIACAIGCDP